jgi:ADP-L-glycero-D-manno-heptose 6-epimerase
MVEFKRRGYDILCFDSDCDISDITNEIKYGVTLVHQGAISDTQHGDNSELMMNNYEKSKILFDASYDNGCNVVYASSAASYGQNGSPSNIYGWSKYCAEQYGIALFGDGGESPSFIALRYFNVFGSGESHKGNMSSIAYRAMKNGVMSLFPGKPKRDFVYIKDVVDANFHAIKCEKVNTGYYEVGSGEAHSFEEVCETLGVEFDYLSESAVPDGYQFFTRSSRDRWMPEWSPKYGLKDALMEYKKEFLHNE